MVLSPKGDDEVAKRLGTAVDGFSRIVISTNPDETSKSLVCTFGHKTEHYPRDWFGKLQIQMLLGLISYTPCSSAIDEHGNPEVESIRCCEWHVKVVDGTCFLLGHHSVKADPYYD